MVRKCSAAQYLRFLASIPRNGVIPEDFPYVDTVDATAVRVQPIGKFTVTVQGLICSEGCGLLLPHAWCMSMVPAVRLHAHLPDCRYTC